MAVRLKEWQKPWVAWDGINISDNHVISVLLRAANNLIHVNEDRELYVDLQLDDWIAPDDEFPAWVTVGKILAEDWWQRSGLILNWQTISWDYARLILATNWTLYIDKGTGIWEEIWWGSGWDSNVKYFNLPNLSNAQVWQAVIDWFLDGNYPIVVYQWETYLVQAQPMANTLRFYDIHPIVTSVLNHWFSTVELNTLYLYWDNSQIFDSWSIDRIWISPQVLATNVDYQNPYQPQYPWSPTTKQYVDNRITISATAPDYPIQGTLWYDTTNDVLKSYDGTNWNTIGSGGGGSYTAWDWIDITSNVITNTMYPWSVWNQWQVLKSNWDWTTYWDTDNDTTYWAWDWISIDGNNDISIDTTWATSWQVLSVDAQWNPVWATPSGGTQYTAWEWIDIDWNNEISIDMTWATNGQVLSTDWSGNIVWITPSWGSMNLIAGDNIQIFNNVTIEDTKGPCPMWFHVPLSTERNALWAEMQALWLDSQWTWYAMENYLYMPAAWYLDASWSITDWWTYYGVWCADEDAFNFGYTFDTSNRNAFKINWLNIRPFADSPVVPDSTWSVVYDGSSVATGAWVFWHGIYWVISISSDGVNWITIADKNLWANYTYVPWDTITSDTRWNYYQWWNCYWFDVAPATSYDTVDATWYWPGNYYYGDKFVLGSYNRQIWNNSNLWWGVSHQSVTGTMISATDTDTTYSAGNWISIDSYNVISNTMYPASQGTAWQVLKIDANWDTYWDNESWGSYQWGSWITINGPYIINDLWPSNVWAEWNALILNSSLEPQWWTVSTFPWMTVLSYGHSTWSDFINAYNNNAIVYCKASSNSNPWTWTQWRMAFMAYVNLSWTTPTEVEFQYYRSRSNHNSDANQQDEVYVYKLTNSWTWTWSVEVRNAAAKIATWTGLSASYSNGVMTLNNTNYANVKAWNIDTYDTGSGTYPRITSALLEEIVVWLVQTWGTRLESDAILKDSNTWDIFNLVKYVAASWADPARLEFLGTKRVTYPGTSQWVTGEYTHGYMRLFTIYIDTTGWTISYSCSLDKSTDTETITNYLSVEGSWYTTAFIPTLDHQPTTKKYVDDKFWNTLATDSAYWTVKLWSSTVQTEAMQNVTSVSWRTYWVQVNSNWQMVVNVPWERQWITKDTTWTTYSMDHVWVGTWVQYGALSTIDANTLYVIL